MAVYPSIELPVLFSKGRPPPRAIKLNPGQSDLYLLQADIARSGGRKETALSAGVVPRRVV